MNRLGPLTVALIVCLAAGCAGIDIHTGLEPGERLELEDTPFFPQKTNQCGPAALAMVLGASGVKVDPDELAPLIYVPGRRGSFQVELMAAGRRFGRIPYEITPNLAALIEELRAHRPVLVLQNLAFETLPAYHYAVVIGMNGADQVILRSGTHRRVEMDLALFMMSWKRPGCWGIVLLKPGELPADPDPERYIQAVSAVEHLGKENQAAKGYDAALKLWPNNQLVLFASANNHFARGRITEAETLYRYILSINPDHIAAANNLAELLASKGCYQQAIEVINPAAERAIRMNSPLKEIILQTRDKIEKLL